MIKNVDTVCWICRDTLYRPHRLKVCQRHAFCRGCLRRWIKIAKNCPMCRTAGTEIVKVKYSDEYVRCSFCEEIIQHKELEIHERRRKHKRCFGCKQPLDANIQFCSLPCRLSKHLEPYERSIAQLNFFKNFIALTTKTEADYREFSRWIGERIYNIIDILEDKLKLRERNITENDVFEVVGHSILSKVQKIFSSYPDTSHADISFNRHHLTNDFYIYIQLLLDPEFVIEPSDDGSVSALGDENDVDDVTDDVVDDVAGDAADDIDDVSSNNNGVADDDEENADAVPDSIEVDLDNSSGVIGEVNLDVSSEGLLNEATHLYNPNEISTALNDDTTCIYIDESTAGSPYSQSPPYRGDQIKFLP